MVRACASGNVWVTKGPNLTRIRQAGAERPDNNRSSITNGARLFPKGVDGRSARGRRWRDIYYGFLAQLGGEGTATAYETAQARDLAAMRLAMEEAQAAQVEGKPFDLAGYANAAAIFRSIARDLGLHERPDLAPTWPADEP